MVLASGTLGFAAGRTSAWFLPFDAPAGHSARQAASVVSPDPERIRAKDSTRGTGTPAPESTVLPAPPRSPTKAQEARQDGPAISGPPQADAPTTPPPASSPEERKETKSAPSKTSLSGGDVKDLPTPAVAGPPAGNRESKPATSSITVLNPSQQHGAPRSDLPSTAAAAAHDDGRGATAPGFAECERRYSSFRASDGTYQPYGSGSRARCPHLR
jgi:hypothetical protein